MQKNADRSPDHGVTMNFSSDKARDEGLSKYVLSLEFYKFPVNFDSSLNGIGSM